MASMDRWQAQVYNFNRWIETIQDHSPGVKMLPVFLLAKSEARSGEVVSIQSIYIKKIILTNGKQMQKLWFV